MQIAHQSRRTPMYRPMSVLSLLALTGVCAAAWMALPQRAVNLLVGSQRKSRSKFRKDVNRQRWQAAHFKRPGPMTWGWSEDGTPRKPRKHKPFTFVPYDDPQSGSPLLNG